MTPRGFPLAIAAGAPRALCPTAYRTAPELSVASEHWRRTEDTHRHVVGSSFSVRHSFESSILQRLMKIAPAVSAEGSWRSAPCTCVGIVITTTRPSGLKNSPERPSASPLLSRCTDQPRSCFRICQCRPTIMCFCRVLPDIRLKELGL